MSAFHGMTLAPVALFVGAVVIGAALNPIKAETVAAAAPKGPLSCEIQKKASGGMMQLLALVRSDAAVAGSYAFKVTSSSAGGSSNINQGGPFMAAAREATPVGTVSVGPGASYKATLTVTTADGKTATCTDPAVL